MRILTLVAIALVLLPEGLSAQRLPPIGRRPPPLRPQDLPPQPPAIARELAYKRSKLAVETYPLVSYMAAPSASANALGSRTSYGAGTRADLRVARRVSLTLDITSSFLGGSSNTETVELGTRFRPERNERRIYPFLDLRGGYVHTFDSFARPFDYVDGSAGQAGFGGRYSSGFGAIAGVGTEVALTRRFSITTAGSVLRSRMRANNIYGPAPSDGLYSMTTYRFTFGLRYNPVRLIRPTDLQ